MATTAMPTTTNPADHAGEVTFELALESAGELAFTAS